MATWEIRGFTTLIRLSAWTTSGQFWHDSEKNVSNRKWPSSPRTRSSSSGSAVEGWPPTCSRASTNDVNS